MKIEWRIRPFFYFSFIVCLFSLIWSFDPIQNIIERPSRSRINELMSRDSGHLFLGGKIVSEVESRQVFGGDVKEYFILETERVWTDLNHEGDLLKTRVRVSWKNPPKYLSYGNTLVLEGELADFPGKKNPGGFDSRAYWLARGVRAAFYADPMCHFKILNQKGGYFWIHWAIRAKREFSKKISWDFEPAQAAFLKALYLGEKSDLDQDFKDLFLKTGTMHLLAVSGFNIGFLIAVITFFLKPFPIPQYIRLAVLIVFSWVYCLLVGWQAPVARATLMATIFLAGSGMGRKTDGLNVLGLSACIILLINPRQILDTGFQLSFAAVLGLISAVPVFLKKPVILPNEKKSFFEKIWFYVSELFWVSFVSFFVTLPITIQNFFMITPYAIVSNLLVVPMTFLLFFLGVPYLLFSLVGGKILAMAVFPAKMIISGITKILFFMENIPGAVWVTGLFPAWLWILFTAGIIFILAAPFFKTRPARALSLVFFSLSMISLQEIQLQLSKKFQMTMLDVGQGDSIFFEFPNGGNLLVDAGSGRFSDKGRWVIGPFLRSKGVRAIDAVLISHPQEDHVGGLPSLFENFKIRRVFHAGFSYDSPRWNEFENMMEMEKCSVFKIGRGRQITGYPGTELSVFYPELDAQPESNMNNESVVFKLLYGDVSFLMTGDVESRGMEAILNSGQDVNADILKVPHHGSKTNLDSKDFFEAVSPHISLISAGARNPFRHPSAATLELLEAIEGNKILRTDQQGAITIRSDGSRILLD